MTISFSIQNSFELRSVVDALTFAFGEIAEGRLFREDDTLTKIMKGLAIDKTADNIIGSYNDNKASAEFSVVAVSLSDQKINGTYSNVECEYCQNRQEVLDAIQLFKDKGFTDDEISIKRLNYCQSHRDDDDDDTFFDDDSPTLLNDNDEADKTGDNDYDPEDYCSDFGS